MKKHQQEQIEKKPSLNYIQIQETNKCSMIQFYSWATQRQINSIRENKFIYSLLLKSTWTLQHGTYNNINGAFLFGILYKSNIQRLGLSHNKRPNIIREIKQINFPILTKLLLSGNHITSLEFLDHLQAPLLESIALSNFLIIFSEQQFNSYKINKKMQFLVIDIFWNMYDYFNKEKNYIKDFSIMAKTITKKLCQLLIQISQQLNIRISTQNIEGQNMNWLTKIDSQNLEQLCKNINLTQGCKVLKEQTQKKFKINFIINLINQPFKCMTKLEIQIPSQFKQKIG